MRTLERAFYAAKTEWRSQATSALGTSVAFLCLIFALLSVVNLAELSQRWENSGRLSVFLAPTATESQVRELTQALLHSDGVESAEFVSSAKAQAELLADVQSPLLEALPSEAFPPSVEVKLTDQTSKARGQAIAEALSRLPAVESLETYATWTQRMSKLTGAANLAAWVLAAIVFLAVITVVASTTQLALQKRREEVEVLRMVGATAAYIRGPFLVAGAVQGAVGAALALGFGALAFLSFEKVFEGQLTILLGVPPSFLPWTFCLGLLGCGAALGSLAAHLSLWRSDAR